MTKKATLLAYLAEPVLDAIDARAIAQTYITKSDAETSDDRPIGTLGVPDSMLASTRITEDDKETFDEARQLVVPESLLASTNVTRVERETYDDNAMVGLDVPRALLEQTGGTRSDKETFDDDPGLWSMGTPALS